MFKTTSVIYIRPEKLALALQNPRYEAYARSIGERLRAAAILIFARGQDATNEQRTSNRTPPKYISSFRVAFYKKTLTTRVSNVDPGWATVEFGFHPGGQEQYVQALKPLRRGLLAITTGL